MPGQLLWRVEILNKEEVGDVWHAIKSQVRLVHVTSQTALRFTGRQLPAWGFNQHEVAADKNLNHIDSVWNVEEHRYTKSNKIIFISAGYFKKFLCFIFSIRPERARTPNHEIGNDSDGKDLFVILAEI
jgi:dolichyl-phosphate-mannose--protein O-mannosyl transferase